MSKQLSKFLSKHLRHTPEALGLRLEPGGWVRVDDLLLGCENVNFPVTYDELVEVVETNDKKRFSFDVTGDLIRANQGHSTEVDLQLVARKPPDVLYHGTVDKFVPSILNEGLQKRTRHHVHMSTNVETARKVGSRRGKPVILQINAKQMHEMGLKFFESVNGVWLADEVPPEFISNHVVD